MDYKVSMKHKTKLEIFLTGILIRTLITIFEEKVDICQHMTAEFFLQSISPNELTTYLMYINIKFLPENIMCFVYEFISNLKER